MVAYLILSYTLPELAARLVATLRAGSPDAVVAVHHDDRRTTLGPVDALRIPPVPIEWGHGSQLAAVLRALRWLRERAAFDWVVLLSGQDYPIRPVGEIEAELLGADVDAFIQHAPVAPLRAQDEFVRRYRYRWRPGSARLARLDPLIHVRRLPSGTYVGLPARPPLPLYHGSDWFTLSARAVDALLTAPAPVVDHFLHTIVPTEGFAATVLASSGLRLRDDDRRFAQFAPGSANPHVLGVDDLGAALATGGHFARKFEDLAVLDELDRCLGAR
ncbi:MAG TPA: beta-1,6-N-acetylglucosaminyltransferase [Solirubrobacter sp.]|nr:beta-1,6-N-acetylglucosaminyltransferase [Solirubrobacter sp.]